MKFLFCICIALFACQQALALTESDLDASDLACLKELNLDSSVLISGYDEHFLLKEGNPQINQVFSCAWKKDGLRNENGELLVDKLLEYVESKAKELYPNQDSQKIASGTVNSCKGITGTDDGDASVKIYNCILTKASEIISN